MISTSEAKELIHSNVRSLNTVRLPLPEAAGLTLAEAITATLDIPAFPQSSMDGYAFSFDGWKSNRELVIDGEMAAGAGSFTELSPGKAIRIFTGAPVPPGADTVVMQERVHTENGKLDIEDEQLQKGANVRPQGSEIKSGMPALSKGTQLTPAAIGFLAGIGITEVTVIPHPSVTIIVTGNELQEPGQPLQYGQVYESNSFALTAAFKLMGVKDLNILQVRDDPSALTSALQQGLDYSDMVLLTGGVSVGDYDFVPKAVMNCGVKTVFHKVRQRPGKPFFFGKKEDRVVFGLPGNPSSVLTCFYMYVVPALEIMCRHNFGLRTIQVPIGKTFTKAGGLTHFLKGIYDGNVATPLPAQESYRMHSFAQANCLIQINEDVTVCEEGALVKTHLFLDK